MGKFLHASRLPLHAPLGFTLVELLVVVSILAILLSIGIASYNNFNKSQQLKQAQENISATIKLAQTRAQTNDLAALCKEQDNRGFDGWYVHAHQSNNHIEHISGSCSYADGSGRIDIGEKLNIAFLTQYQTFSNIQVFDSNDQPIVFDGVGDGVYLLFPPLNEAFVIYRREEFSPTYQLNNAAKVVLTLSDDQKAKTITVLQTGVVTTSQ